MTADAVVSPTRFVLSPRLSSSQWSAGEGSGSGLGIPARAGREGAGGQRRRHAHAPSLPGRASATR